MDKKKSIINIQDLGLSAGNRYYKFFIYNFLFLEKKYSIFKNSFLRKFFKISAGNRFPKWKSRKFQKVHK
jgi:hypothetical protein